MKITVVLPVTLSEENGQSVDGHLLATLEVGDSRLRVAGRFVRFSKAEKRRKRRKKIAVKKEAAG